MQKWRMGEEPRVIAPQRPAIGSQFPDSFQANRYPASATESTRVLWCLIRRLRIAISEPASIKRKILKVISGITWGTSCCTYAHRRAGMTARTPTGNGRASRAAPAGTHAGRPPREPRFRPRLQGLSCINGRPATRRGPSRARRPRTGAARSPGTSHEPAVAKSRRIPGERLRCSNPTR